MGNNGLRQYYVSSAIVVLDRGLGLRPSAPNILKRCVSTFSIHIPFYIINPLKLSGKYMYRQVEHGTHCFVDKAYLCTESRNYELSVLRFQDSAAVQLRPSLS